MSIYYPTKALPDQIAQVVTNERADCCKTDE